MSFDPTVSLGMKARICRVSRLLTQQELAAMVGVSQDDVNLLEHNLPLQLNVKLKLLRELGVRINAYQALS